MWDHLNLSKLIITARIPQVHHDFSCSKIVDFESNQQFRYLRSHYYEHLQDY